VEVVATWGDGEGAPVLAITYVPPGVPFTVGKGGRYDLALPAEAMGDVTIRERVVEDEPWPDAPIRRRVWLPPRELLASALAHVVVLLLAALARPSDAAISPDEIATMRHLLAATAEPRPDDRAQAATVLGASRHERPSAARAEAPSRPAAHDAPFATPPARASSATTPVALAPAESRAAAVAEARSFGMVSLVQALAIPPNEASAWTEKTTALSANESVLHSMFDDGPIGGSRGAELAESAVQGGGGGKGAGVPIPPPDFSLLTPPPAHPLPDRRSSVASLHPHSVALLMASFGEDVVRRVVHADAGRLRQCYQRSLRANPTLSGRVVVAFTVGPTGAVTSARDDGGDLDDAPARACIVRGFYALRFPPPASGHVDITYPFVLTPGE
jgi:hypothetical protein